MSSSHSAFLAAALLFQVGCGQPFWNPPPPPPPPPTPPPAWVASIVAIDLKRTACLGHCPHYRVRFRAEGSATYVGYSDTTRLGTYASPLDTVTFRSLAAELLRNGFFEHPRSLGIPLDAPITIVRVTVEDPAPRWKVAAGAHPDYHYLWPLAQRLDSVAATLSWRWVSSDTTGS